MDKATHELTLKTLLGPQSDKSLRGTLGGPGNYWKLNPRDHLVSALLSSPFTISRGY